MTIMRHFKTHHTKKRYRDVEGYYSNAKKAVNGRLKFIAIILKINQEKLF